MRKVMFFCIWLAMLLCVEANIPAEAIGGKAPIYISFYTHMQRSPIRGVPGTEGYTGQGPAPYSVHAKNLVDIWEKYGVKGEYATTGLCLQQLLVDFPETVDKIKRLKLPVSRYPGSGHEEPCPVGRMRFTAELPLEEAIRAEWEFETQTLTPAWHLVEGKVVLGNSRASNPLSLDELAQYNLPKESWQLFGGTLAVEAILDVIPMSVFEARFKEGFVRTEEPGLFDLTPVWKALGFGSYAISYNAGATPARTPVVSNIEGLRFLKDNWPREKPLYMEIAQFGGPQDEELIKFLLENPTDFKIIWPDPEARQWEAENSASNFFRKRYGAKSLEQAHSMPCPVKNIINDFPATARNEKAPPLPGHEKDKTFTERLLSIKDFQGIIQHRGYLPPDLLPVFGVHPTEMPEHMRPAKRTVSIAQIFEASEYLLTNWPHATHDGDPGGPPDYIETKKGNLSLADAFQGLAFVLDHYVLAETLPKEVEIQDVLGPVDYPMFRLEKEPRFDPEKVITGYLPFELDPKYFPDPELVKSQGLMGGVGPRSVYVNDVDLLHAASKVAAFIRDEWQIPGVIDLFVPTAGAPDRLGQREEETKVNPAEFLYGMAQEVLQIRDQGLPGRVLMMTSKIVRQQRCKYIMMSTPISYRGGIMMSPMVTASGFLWRDKLPSWVIDAAWNYAP